MLAKTERASYIFFNQLLLNKLILHNHVLRLRNQPLWLWLFSSLAYMCPKTQCSVMCYYFKNENITAFRNFQVAMRFHLILKLCLTIYGTGVMTSLLVKLIFWEIKLQLPEWTCHPFLKHHSIFRVYLHGFNDLNKKAQTCVLSYSISTFFLT